MFKPWLIPDTTMSGRLVNTSSIAMFTQSVGAVDRVDIAPDQLEPQRPAQCQGGRPHWLRVARRDDDDFAEGSSRRQRLNSREKYPSSLVTRIVRLNPTIVLRPAGSGQARETSAAGRHIASTA